MDKLRILVTGGGSPGTAGTLYSLKGHYVVCTDVKDNVPGKYLADKFYQIAPAWRDWYISNIEAICHRENIDVILPQNTAELDILLKESPVPCAVNRNITKDEVSEGRWVEGAEDIMSLGWDRFVVKPPNMSGGRGVRIVSDNRDFFRKPGIPIVTVDELIGDMHDFFELWAMPFYEGTEFTVDCFNGKSGFTAIPRTREEIRSGISFTGRVVKDVDLIDKCRGLTEDLGLKYAFGFQFIGGNVLECNPRVQGTMVVSTLAGANMIEAACFEALGIDYPPFDINWDLSFTRYWGMIADGKRI